MPPAPVGAACGGTVAGRLCFCVMPTRQLKYGATAKLFHWTVVVLLVIQAPLGWLMPDIHRGMTPGTAMSLHVSIGITILILIVLRFLWRLTHPVAPENLQILNDGCLQYMHISP